MINNKHIFKFLANATLVLTFVVSTTNASSDFFKKLKDLVTVKADTTSSNITMAGPTPPYDGTN